jgi:hypothetical protein
VHIGGAGHTDIVATAPLGIHRYSIVIDAKTTGRTRIAEGQVNFLAIDAHRKQKNAEYAAVVGPDFAGGNLIKNAEALRVNLVSTEQLISLVQMHDLTPFTLDQLKPLFEPGTLVASTTINELKSLHRKLLRRWLVMGLIMSQIAVWSARFPDSVLAQPTALFTVLLERTNETLAGLTVEEVDDALRILSSDTIGVLVHVANGSEGYVLTTTPSGARQRLEALAKLAGRRLDTDEAQPNVPLPQASPTA